MNKPFTTIAAIGFAIIAILHLWRLLAGTPINIGTVQFPVWASVIAFWPPLCYHGAYGKKEKNDYS